MFILGSTSSSLSNGEARLLEPKPDFLAEWDWSSLGHSGRGGSLGRSCCTQKYKDLQRNNKVKNNRKEGQNLPKLESKDGSNFR